ncbi:MAG: 5'-methylthioadenosine/adenosylhomocysteine nucleosidase [Acholeplasmatales bacterium]|nr:5'-methylthioadenosine/adenosylhomocysteine nucleosidase [Acholeplasmatales bacterium]
MEKIGIIAAMKEEMDGILSSMEDLNTTKYLGIEFNEGTINDIEIVLVESGMGKANAAMATTLLISEFGCDLIINTGIAGGLKGVETKDVVIANNAMYNDVDARLFGYEYGQVPGMPKYYTVNPECLTLVKSTLNKLEIKYKEGLILSGDKFVSSYDTISECKDLGALAVEMEGTAVAQVCTRAGRDFIILRYISDVVGLPSQNEDYLKFEDEMARRSIKITLALINSL